jgi:hypothetical protein
MISRRTQLSLIQYLELQEFAFTNLMLEKHGIAADYSYQSLERLNSAIKEASTEKTHALLDEIIRTSGDLRNRISPRYRYDERFSDLEKCLLLDGYEIKSHKLTPIDPTIIETPSLEDDLTKILNQSGLSEAAAILKKLSDSAEAFCKSEPDFNGSLNNARVALQTLATAIAKGRAQSVPGNFDEKKWGSVLAYLRSSGFITEDQEKGLAGVFGFVSPGSHIPLGLTELEMARLGRSFIAGMCWFLVKRFTEGKQ